MKKTILSLSLIVMALTASAQSVTYFRVQFTENLEQVKTYAADGKTFFNPAYDYLDFKGSLPFTNGSKSGTVDEYSYYYIGNSPTDRTPFTLAHSNGTLAIRKVSAYSQPIETITVSSQEGTNANGQKTVTFTFNALPRNIEELKTLEVENRKYFESPYFVTALFICCLNRIVDNSADSWEMINYLHILAGNWLNAVHSDGSRMGTQIVNHLPRIGTIVDNTVQTTDKQGRYEIRRLEILTILHLQRLQLLDIAR